MNQKDLLTLKIHLEDEESIWVLWYSKFVDEKDVVAISLLKDLFVSNFQELNATQYDYFPLEKEIHITLDNWTKLIFDLISDPKDQLNKLKILIKEQELSDLVYTDLRIEWRIFYCPKKDEHEWDNTTKCYNNLKEIYNYKLD